MRISRGGGVVCKVVENLSWERGGGWGGVTMNRRAHQRNNGSERGVGGFPDVWEYLEIFSINPLVPKRS
jgi:hypothetical protein